MDIEFYVLVAVACLVLLLAMWACSSQGTSKWGPDLTAELPAHVIQEALFNKSTNEKTKFQGNVPREAVPSAPSDLPGDPLLSHAAPMGQSDPPLSCSGKPLFKGPVVRVLPPTAVSLHKLKPPKLNFVAEQPV